MAAIDFPNSPSLNQEFTAGTTIYFWDGTVWKVKSSTQPPSSSIVSYSANAPVGPVTGQVWVESDVDVNIIDTTTFYTKTETDNALALKANLASPTFTGTPAAPTANAGTNTTQIATTAFVRTEIAGIVDSAPSTLDTLNELAAALGDDPNFATTVTNSIAEKISKNGGDTITVSTGSTVPLTIQNNGTGNSFVINDESSDSTPFVISSSGNVGIRVANPAEALDVSGNIKTNGTILSSSDLLLTDSTSVKGRIVASPTTFFIQAGQSPSDTAAQLNISRNSTTATNISQFNIYSDATNFNGNVKLPFDLNTGGTNIVDSRTITDSSAVNLTNVLNYSGILFVHTGQTTAIPFYPNGGAGIGYKWTVLDPDTGWNVNWAGSFSFVQAGSGNHTFTVTFAQGSGMLSIQRTAGTGTYYTKLMAIGGW